MGPIVPAHEMMAQLLRLPTLATRRNKACVQQSVSQAWAAHNEPFVYAPAWELRRANRDECRKSNRIILGLKYEAVWLSVSR